MASKSLTIAAALLFSASVGQAATVYDIGSGGGHSYYDVLDRMFLLEGGASETWAPSTTRPDRLEVAARAGVFGPIDHNEEDHILGRSSLHLRALIDAPAEAPPPDSVGLPRDRVVGGQNEPGQKLNNGVAAGRTGGNAGGGPVAAAPAPAPLPVAGGRGGVADRFARSVGRSGFRQAVVGGCVQNCAPRIGGTPDTPGTPFYPPGPTVVTPVAPVPVIAPVPLPAGVFLLMGGLGALGLMRRSQTARSAA
ncbi:VPLPA-CTERM sorting domain-containing protein [Gymnodinialimonas sp. 2305UL16-5]|uniref:VPLPA-CTERM sorting domain-containing protein n=1 Tax=Gymnodinialimonas mytili TaxID=3126503 RepID=UPI003095AA55